ncbi:MAG: MarR family transcriptional regulator [Methylococcaceae bacterium]|nr:MarR family transcriptional regulator [Methylococcaceae bacterium]
MNNVALYDLIESMSALIRSEERRRCSAVGLQLVHLQVLHYLSRCNRYSDVPAALSLYLGVTRGTISQTLLLLEKKGFIAKTADKKDGRVVHLHLLPAGKAIVEQARPTDLLDRAERILQQSDLTLDSQAFSQALMALQKANHGQSFGLCRTCKHFTRIKPDQFQCGLTLEALSTEDSQKICQEHSLVADDPI